MDDKIINKTYIDNDNKRNNEEGYGKNIYCLEWFNGINDTTNNIAEANQNRNRN